MSSTARRLQTHECGSERHYEVKEYADATKRKAARTFTRCLGCGLGDPLKQHQEQHIK